MKASILFVLAILVVGCGHKEEPITPPTTPSAKQGAALGSKQEGDHFAVTLSTEPADLKVGKAKFVAAIDHHGQPTEVAKVKIALSMPSMNMGGPVVELKHVAGGKYEGEADLSMGGVWQATVSVEQEGHPGEVIYSFTVSQ